VYNCIIRLSIGGGRVFAPYAPIELKDKINMLYNFHIYGLDKRKSLDRIRFIRDHCKIINLNDHSIIINSDSIIDEFKVKEIDLVIFTFNNENQLVQRRLYPDMKVYCKKLGDIFQYTFNISHILKNNGLYVVRWIPKDQFVVKPGWFLNNNLDKIEILLDNRCFSNYNQADMQRVLYEIWSNTGTLKLNKDNDEMIKDKSKNEMYPVPQSKTAIANKIPMTYYLVEDGINPKTNMPWYNMVKASDDKEAQKIATANGMGKVIDKLVGNFRESIGILIYDHGLRPIDVKPIALRPRNKNGNNEWSTNSNKAGK